MSQSIEKTLEHNIVKIKPVGYSMYPVIVPGRDYVYIEKADYGTLKRGDVILYKRPEPESIYVLHRIYKVKPDGVYTVGDNQSVCEGPLAREQILGKAPKYIWINDNGPFDFVRDGIEIQQKFVNSGNHLSLFAIKQHYEKYPWFLDGGRKYQIPADHYEKIKMLLS